MTSALRVKSERAGSLQLDAVMIKTLLSSKLSVVTELF